jgi:hypothetical protein
MATAVEQDVYLKASMWCPFTAICDDRYLHQWNLRAETEERWQRFQGNFRKRCAEWRSVDCIRNGRFEIDTKYRSQEVR